MPIAPLLDQRDAVRRTSRVARNIAALVLLLTFVVAGCAAPPVPTPTAMPTVSPRAQAQAAVARGEQARASGDLAQAIAEYTRAVELNSTCATAYAGRGAVYLEQKQFTRALDDFARALERDPQASAAYFGRAQAHHQTGNLSQARLDYNAALALDSKIARAWLGRGEIAMTQLAFDAAFDDFSRAVELDPRLVDAYLGRGTLYARRDQFIQAIADYTAALELDAKSVRAYAQRAAAYGALGERDSQIADLSRVIDLTPQDATAYVNRAAAFSAQQKFDHAVADYTRAIQLEPKSLTHYAKRARAFQDAGKLSDAIADYSKIIELDAKNAEAFYQRGHVYARQNERAKALGDFSSAIRLNPNFISQPLIDPLNVQFNLGDDVPGSDRQTIQNSILLTQNFLNSQFDAQVDAFTTTAALLKSDPWLNPSQVIRMEQGNVVGIAGHKHIAILISPRFRNFPLEVRLGTLAHEYFHLWQDHLSGTTGVPGSKTVPRQGPIWLIEGCAEYIEDVVLEFHGMKSPRTIPYVPLSAPLMEMESRGGADETFEGGEYYLGYHACRYLEKKAGRDAVVRTYWEGLRKGGTWQENFKTTFGIAREEFYTEFEGVRRLTPTPIPPATRIPTRAPTPTGTPRP